MNFKLYITTVLILINLQSFGQHQNFDNQWRFIQQDIIEAQNVNYNDAKWRKLNLPHDWSIEGEYKENNPMGPSAGYLPAGIGWYRKTIIVPETWKGKSVEIAFDGVFMNSTVYVNGKKLGTRPYGWVSFAYDISAEVKKTSQVTFAVRVDNSQQPAARWYTGSGIYAHTWINIRNQVHVKNDGIFVTTKKSKATVITEVENNTSKNKTYWLKTSIKDSQGKIVTTTTSKLAIDVGSSQKKEQLLDAKNPKLWSVEQPKLYTLVTEVYDEKVLQDKVETKFGFRDIEWKPETGMWINGVNVKLRGVCNHQDAGALGAAVPDKIVRFRIQQLKNMGVNAIRTAHNAQTPIFYEICDELGMLVMDEFFDGWKTKAAKDYGNQAFAEWWKRDLADLIKRDRNHPSVIIYSIGNETEGDIAKELVATCHKYDPTRPVTSGHSASEEMDVFGVNGNSESEDWFDTLAKDRVFIATENPHTWQVRGFYNTKTWYRNGYPDSKRKPFYIPDLTEKEVFFDDWTYSDLRKNSKQIFNSSYDNATIRITARHSIAQLRDIPNYAGSFRWTGYDYIGEASFVHGGWPFKSFMGGAIDMANFEKDLYYLYQSQWNKTPMVHILPHWTHPNVKLDTPIPVWVYTNADVAELFLNDQSLGKIKPGKSWNKMQCQWLVPWQPGKLKAVAYKDGKIISEETIYSANAPARITLSIDGEPLANNGSDIVQVRITSTDQQGNFQPYGENRTYFHVMGPAEIKALDNGSPIDVEKHFGTNNRIAFFGLTRAYIQSTGNAGNIALLASCILGDKKLKTANLVSIDNQILQLRGSLAKADVRVFYTTDGTLPTTNSRAYFKPFKIELGTTVKAIVLLNNKVVNVLEERFNENMGFVWNDKPEELKKIGEQAESAKYSGAQQSAAGLGFNGKGYLKMDKKPGAYVEWYQENDGGEADANLLIRYSAKADNNTGTYLQITNNGKIVRDKFFIENSKNLGASWNTAKLKFRLKRGANTIRLTTLESEDLFIDEIVIK